MSVRAVGNLDRMLRDLETRLAEWTPRCQFYFGHRDEAQRQKTGPYVAWSVRGGEPQPPREIRPRNQFVTMDDLVVVVARCAGLVPAGELGPDPRRQQTEAALQVFLAVQLAAHQLHQGYIEDRGWEIVGLDLVSDAYVAIDYTFCVRAGRWTPPVDTVQPEQQDYSLETRP